MIESGTHFFAHLPLLTKIRLEGDHEAYREALARTKTTRIDRFLVRSLYFSPDRWDIWVESA